MTQILTIQHAFDAAKLCALLDQIPGMEPVDLPDNLALPNLGITRQSRYSISEIKGGLRIEIPDEVSAAAVRAAVRDHDTTPTAPPVSKRQRAKDALAAIDGSKLTGENKKLLAVLADLVDG